MAHKPKISTVAEGASGVSSFVAYAPILAGNTSTGNLQSTANAGNSGDVLLSQGAGLVPAFQALSSGSGFLIAIASNTGNLASSLTYFLRNGANINNGTTSTTLNRIYIPIAGTLKAIYGALLVQGTLASAGSLSLNFRVNNTTDTLITSSLGATTSSNSISVTGLSLSLSAGDYFEFKLTTPAWTTTPTSASICLTALFQ